VLAFAARRPRDLVIGLWIATVVVAGPSFVYYVNGFAQFGMRHALDFEPFVLVLVALAYPSRVPPWGRALIVWSVLVGIWGVWLTVVLYHHRELLVLVGRNDEYRYVQMTIRPANPGEHSRQRRLRGCRRREIPLIYRTQEDGQNGLIGAAEQRDPRAAPPGAALRSRSTGRDTAAHRSTRPAMRSGSARVRRPARAGRNCSRLRGARPSRR
jgi:hypothetical protein